MKGVQWEKHVSNIIWFGELSIRIQVIQGEVQGELGQIRGELGQVNIIPFPTFPESLEILGRL